MPLPFQNLVGGGLSPTPSPRGQTLSKDVANAPKKEPVDFESKSTENGATSTEEDRISKQLSEMQEELFVSLKEDISDWINRTLGDVDMNADNFVESLDTGVILCRLSKAIEEKARDAFKEGKITEPVPESRLHCNQGAKSGTWFARDNTANFLKWCRSYGMTDETLFDSEDLVTHHQERQVIYCLMEIARLGYKFGLEPPSLIAMEKEIDGHSPLYSPPPRQPVIPPPIPVEIIPKEEEPAPPRPPSPPPPSPPPPPPPPTSPPLPPPPPPPTSPPHRPSTATPRSSRSSSMSTLDSEVNRVSEKCKCQEYVNRISEGVYNVFGKRVFIRLLKGRHLMVRVGGGWDTFENYLLHHDPVQVFEFHSTSPNQGATHSHAVQNNNFKPGAFNGYLVIRSKYKSSNFS